MTEEGTTVNGSNGRRERGKDNRVQVLLVQVSRTRCFSFSYTHTHGEGKEREIYGSETSSWERNSSHVGFHEKWADMSE